MKKKSYESDSCYPDDFRIRIKKEDIKGRIGHKEHDQGCGKHDHRPKRKRTRQTERDEYLKENY